MASTDPITTATNAATAQAAAAVSNTMPADQATFLQLLMTELQNQDPMAPMQSDQFVAELAQFSSLQQLTSINSELQTNSSSTSALQAVSLVGKNVTVQDANTSATIQGAVTSVRVLGNNAPAMTINGQEYPISWLVSVSQ